MSITSTRVKSIPMIYGGCGGQGVQPMGSCSLLAIVEETNGPGGANVIRPFVSLDDGLTWEEEIHHLSADNLSQSRYRMTGSRIVLGGVTGPQVSGEYEQYSSVALRTMNAGHNWKSIITHDTFAAIFDPGNDYWEIQDFVVAGPKVFAVGDFTSFGVSKSYLTSLDGGITFNNPRSIAGAPFGISSGAYLGNDILIFVGTTNPAKVHRSIDGGDSWTSITLPGAAVSTALRAVTPVGPLTDGRVVVVGTRAGVAVAFFSTDFGQTWTQSTLSGGVTAQGAMDVVAPSALDVVMGLNVNAAQVAAGKRPLALSTDGGVTFADFGAYATPLNPALGYVVQQLTVADDGAILAMVQTTDVTNTTPNEIWRAVIDGFVGNGPGVALNRRIKNQAILAWDQATGEYGPAVQWVGPQHVFFPPWELDDPQPAEAEPANQFNTPLDVVDLLNVQLQAFQQARQNLLHTQAALVAASDAGAELNDLLGDGGTLGLIVDPATTNDELIAMAGVVRIFAEEMSGGAEAATEAIAAAHHAATEAGEALDATIAATEGNVVLASHGGRVHLYVLPDVPDEGIADFSEDIDRIDTNIPVNESLKARNLRINLQRAAASRRRHDVDDISDRLPLDIPINIDRARIIRSWRPWEAPPPPPPFGPDNPRANGVRGDVPELLDDLLRKVRDATDAADEFALGVTEASAAARGAAEAATDAAWADASSGCAPS